MGPRWVPTVSPLLPHRIPVGSPLCSYRIPVGFPLFFFIGFPLCPCPLHPHRIPIGSPLVFHWCQVCPPAAVTLGSHQPHQRCTRHPRFHPPWNLMHPYFLCPPPMPHSAASLLILLNFPLNSSKICTCIPSSLHSHEQVLALAPAESKQRNKQKKTTKETPEDAEKRVKLLLQQWGGEKVG